ncbi:hypothetical protein GF369_04440 [Candidatus Peregrinibacteria bacterium]|nr:hypothetical protein [Candidatus Peregrinibacteria bacterium]
MYKKSKKIAGIFLICFVVLQACVIPCALADNGNGSTNETSEKATTVAPSIPQIDTLPGPSSEQKLEDSSTYLTELLLPNIARTITGLAITLSVLFIIFGAIQFLTAYGNDEKLSNAKKTIMFALVGLVLSLLAFAIVQIIFFTGFQVTQIK